MKKTLILIAIIVHACLTVQAQNPTVWGIDVYALTSNGTISWSASNGVASAGKTFAFVKATKGIGSPGGACYTDGEFINNMNGASAAGVITGPYDFALPEDDDATTEADYFYDVAGAYINKPCYLPPALDLEDPAGSCIVHTAALSSYFTSSELAQWVQEWSAEVFARSGVWPVLYTTRCYAAELYPYYGSTINTNIKLWIADWSDPAGYPANTSSCIWNSWPWLFDQYNGTNGTCAGISGYVDLDVFNGDINAFNTLTGCGTTSTCSNFTTTPSSATIAATGGSGSFTWSENGSCSVNYYPALCSWVTFSDGGNGTIDYTVTANCGSAQSCTLDLTYNGNTVTTFTINQEAATSPEPPSVTPSPNTLICSGSPEQLTASEASCTECTYAWSNGDAGASINVYPATSTGYTVTVTNACGLSATNGYYVDVVSLPNQPGISPTTGCSPLSILANSSGCSNCTYSWSTPSGVNSGSSIQGSVSGTYYVTVTNGNGCSASNSASVTITTTSTPNATISSNNSNPICNTASATLSVPSCTGCTYNWSTGATTTQTTVSTASTYYVTVTNSCQQSVSGSYVLTTISAPGDISITGTNTICSNGTAGLTTNPDYSGCTYNWSSYGSSGSNNSISISPSASEQITVTVTNNCGNAVSAPFSLTVNNVPPQPGSIAGSATPCSGSQLTYSVTSTSGYTYTWTLPNGWSGSSNSNSIITTTGASGGTISVTANNNCGSSIPQTLNVSPVYVVASPLTCSPNPVCQNGTVALTANSGAATYQWSGNHVLNANSNSTTATPMVTGSTSYTVTETLNNCSASATVNVTVTPSVTPALSLSQSPGSVCLDGNHMVTITPNPLNGGTPAYNWSSNCSIGSTGSTYTLNDLSTPCIVSCTLTSNAECASPATATAFVNLQTTTPSQVGLSISTPATSVCVGSNVTFTATASNGGTPVYEWFVGGLAAASGPSFTIYNIQNNESFYCSMTSSLACATGSPATSNTVNVVVVTQATASINVTDSPSINVCAGTPVTFTANPGNGGTNPLYQWKINGIDTGSNSASRNFTASTLRNGAIVSCLITSNSNCVTTDTASSNAITMSITPTVTPTISISANPDGTTCSGTPVTFTASTTNEGNLPVYQWKAGGNIVGNNSNIYTSSLLANGEVIECGLTSSANCASPVKLISNNIAVNVDPVVLPSVDVLTYPVGSVCIHTNITFTATPTYGGSSPSYRWRVNNNIIPDTTAIYSSSSLVNGAIVSCVLISRAACAVPDTSITFITVDIDSTITPSVNISADPGTATCASTPVTFTATATGGGTASYQWKVNNNNAGNNSSTFTTPSIVNAAVTCFMTSSLGCASPDTVGSNTITLTVKPAPDTSITPEGMIPLCAGDSVQLNASANNILYHWNTGPTTQSIWVGEGGEYWATVTNNNNCSAISSIAIITVNPLPVTPVIIQHEDTLTTTSLPVSYQWYLNNTTITGAISPMLVAHQNGSYSVAVTDTNGCSSLSAVAKITTVGVNSNVAVFNFTMAPNPSKGQFIISFESLTTEDIQIFIFDPIGRIIKTEPPMRVLGVYSEEINLAGASQGLYIMQLKSGDKILNKKFDIY